jgi:transposase-like protein
MGQQKAKREVVAEYLEGGVSLRELSVKYGINFRTIHRWVKAQQVGEDVTVDEIAGMSRDVRRLQRELYEERLKTKLLETMIDIAERDMGIPIRKKRGAK